MLHCTTEWQASWFDESNKMNKLKSETYITHTCCDLSNASHHIAKSLLLLLLLANHLCMLDGDKCILHLRLCVDLSCQEACAATVHARVLSSSSSTACSLPPTHMTHPIWCVWSCMRLSWYGVHRPSWTHWMRGLERSAPNGITGAARKRGEPPSLPKYCHEPSSSIHSGSLQYTNNKIRTETAVMLWI